MQYLKEEVRARILEAALDEFEAHGYAKAQVQRIAQEAQVSTGNLYRYFASKEDIFDSIVRSCYERIAALMADAAGFSGGGEAKGVRGLAHHLAAGIMSVYNTHGRQLLIIAEKSIGSRHENFVHIMTEMISERMQLELGRQGALADETLVRLVATGFFSGMVLLFRTTKDPERLHELISRMLVFYFDDFEDRLLGAP
ncbi:MAG: TetR/AcrR family transcriptional regulator [Firmicutes bacterium]|nr:TetR/AcrR family transcriptional regulator [Dethiobacter sp.]MBS3889507.1 TetR/AcrR family transcriptional regulator [Bacillota bacterium]MBS4055623.1 TetR/AcrR family transcriptional regulator [Thermaerobacter sp.]